MRRAVKIVGEFEKANEVPKIKSATRKGNSQAFMEASTVDYYNSTLILLTFRTAELG